jgi:hypothetical protein
MDRLHRNLRHRCCCFLDFVGGRKHGGRQASVVVGKARHGWLVAKFGSSRDSVQDTFPISLHTRLKAVLNPKSLRPQHNPQRWLHRRKSRSIRWLVCTLFNSQEILFNQQVANTYQTSKTPPTMPSQHTSIPSPSSNPTPSPTSVSH